MNMPDKNQLTFLKDFFPDMPATNKEALIKELSRSEKAYHKSIAQRKPHTIFEAPKLNTDNHLISKIYDQNIVKIGSANDLSEEKKNKLNTILSSLSPWRKGPFEIFGTYIDAEWQSNMKWDRITPHLPNLKDKIICDVGCGNGYFMFRMLPLKPKVVLGLDPTFKFREMFELIQLYAQEKNLIFANAGWQHLEYFSSGFDFIFAMGIVYHHQDPLALLRTIAKALAPNGQAIIESQGIAGEQSMALFPRKRYAGARGMYFLPTASCLENMIYRAGFSNAKLLHNIQLSTQEQRKTSWANVDSLLENTQNNQTIEGYPIPYRSAFLVKK